jgi:hypothetical protein
LTCKLQRQKRLDATWEHKWGTPQGGEDQIGGLPVAALQATISWANTSTMKAT